LPRANRHFLPGHVWHITHRCHQKKFLLKFARDRWEVRKVWKKWLNRRTRGKALSWATYEELLSLHPLRRPSRLLKKPHRLRCARSPRYNVLRKYASARRFLARLASEIFLSSLQAEFFSNLLGSHTLGPERGV
jgi:hypothetical protein